MNLTQTLMEEFYQARQDFARAVEQQVSGNRFFLTYRRRDGSLEVSATSPSSAFAYDPAAAVAITQDAVAAMVAADPAAALELYGELGRMLNRAGVPIDSSGRVWEQGRLI